MNRFATARAQRLFLSSICFCLLVGTSHAATEPEQTKNTTHYQGAYWSLQGHAGYTMGLEPDQSLEAGPTLGLSLRLASIISLADIQLSALGSSYQATFNTGDEDVLRLSLGLQAHLHPFFLLTLNDSYWETWLAGIYISLGADLDLTRIGEASIEPDFGWHVGLGTDLPLTSLENESSFWLGLGLRLKFLDVRSPAGNEINFNETTIYLTVGYRDHDINFVRLPRPTEFYETIHNRGE